MCGFVGALHPPSQAVAVAEIVELLRHRGPDGTGCHLGVGISLAARRLAIVDRAGRGQPLGNETGDVWTVHNGEIVNAAELRRELEAAGHRFATRSDTEVLVHGWESWGRELVGRLRGMFAFAIWDARSRQLLLARDRFGIKPLYWARDGDRLAFASSAAAVLAALPGRSPRLDPVALEQLFTVGFIAAPRSIFADVKRLPAAHDLLIGGGREEPRRYWSPLPPPLAEATRTDPRSAAAVVRAGLREAVAAWRVADVPIAALLSGGIDSATVAVLLREAAGAPPDTFTIGFESATRDERAAARSTARYIGGRHHEVLMTGADFDLLPEVVRHTEQPLCSGTAVPLYRLFEDCRRAGIAAVMTGEGADELFGGYGWYGGDRWARPLLGLPRPLRRLLAASPLPMSRAARRVVADGDADPRRRYGLWQQVTDARLRQRLLANATANADCWADGVPAAELAGRHPFDQFVLLDAATRLGDLLCLEVDAMSMAHGVEARPPLLDHRLWGLCAALPPSAKLGLATTKLALRRAVADLLPRRVARRRKHGLASPHGEWWRRERLPDWAEQCLDPAELRAAGYFDAPTVSAIRAAHRSRRSDAAGVLTGVLTTQLWHWRFITGRAARPVPALAALPEPAPPGDRGPA